MLIGTVKAQKLIHQSQHPASTCSASSTRYLIVHQGRYMTGHGIGSLIHSLASSLALAIASNRILLYDPGDGLMFATDQSATSEPFKCRETTSFECFFRPISNCTYFDAMSQQTSKLEFLLPSKALEYNPSRVLITTGEAFKKVPSVIMSALIGSEDLVEDKWAWWKAQAVAYLMRPNEKTLIELRRRRGQVFGVHTLPTRGTVSTHVRHGDKGLEMKLVSMKDYLTTADMLLKIIDKREGLDHRPAVFVSTEDPAAIDTAREWTDQNNWDLYYTDIRRVNLPLTGLVQEFGGVNEMLNSLLNLQIAVECDYWVCTLSSNWCGLIDELRSISGGKAHHPYVDIGYPCFQGC